MEISHSEIMELYNTILSKDIQSCINLYLEMKSTGNVDNVIKRKFWEEDKKIGGIGGYCMPSNPIKNPFSGGVKREFYRPLQYARSNIDILDINFTARYIIQSCGMHLEAICRELLKRNNLIKIRFNNITLGQSIEKISKQQLISKEIVDALYKFVKIYNKSKHEVNQSNKRVRLFNSKDALAMYFIVRILGVKILRKMEIEDSFYDFELIDC